MKVQVKRPGPNSDVERDGVVEGEGSWLALEPFLEPSPPLADDDDKPFFDCFEPLGGPEEAAEEVGASKDELMLEAAAAAAEEEFEVLLPL